MWSRIELGSSGPFGPLDPSGREILYIQAYKLMQKFVTTHVYTQISAAIYYRTQVYLGSDLWVQVPKVRDVCADLTGH